MRIRLLVCLGLNAAAVAGDFSQFRGPRGWGIVPDQPIPREWSVEQNVAWKVPIPGAGWSQPIVRGDRVFVTTAVSDKPLRPKNFKQGVRMPQSFGMGFLSQAPDVQIEWKLYCLNVGDGALLWAKTIESGKPSYPVHPSNTFATESPVADANGVYVYFGAAGKVAGLSYNGDLQWQQDVGVYKTSNGFGTGSSLAIHDGKVYLQNLSEGSADVYCFDARTGDIVWKATRDTKATSWSTPLIWANDQRVEVVVSATNRSTVTTPTRVKFYGPWVMSRRRRPARRVPIGSGCTLAAAIRFPKDLYSP